MSQNLKLFGNRLKEAIEEKGFTISEISKATKIRKVFIEALINGEKENLPTEVFVLGYLKAILDYIKVEPDSFIEEYKALSKKDIFYENDKREDFTPLPKIKSKSHFFLWLVFVFLILILSGFFLFRNAILDTGSNLFQQKNYYFQEKKETPKQIIASKPNEESVDSSTSAEKTEKEPVKETTVENLPDGLVVKSYSRCWVELFGERGNILLKRELSEGEEINFKGKNFRITIGDPSVVKLFLDKKEIDFPREKGKVLRDFKISGESE